MIEEQYLPMYRHSLAHILAKAVIKFYGDEKIQIAIGPQIDNGFYYDFGLPHAITEADFPAIEKLMNEAIKKGDDFVRQEVTKKEALEIFADQKYKVELINDLPEGETITIYKTGDFVDLCRGPHVSNTKDLQSAAFKIASTSSAYWRGDEHNDVLQRVYVYAYPSKGELKEYLDFLAEAKARDHKVLGPQLDLFFFDQNAPGMPYWLPNGLRMLNTILQYWREEHETLGYHEVATPLLNKNALWVTSGHWDHYRNGMFVMEDKDDDSIWGLKPMNCPNSVVIYKRKRHSYKEFPLRYSDSDVLHRKEKSGELNGLLRVQMFRQDDSHNYVTEDQIAEEVNNILDIADRFYGIFGLTYRPELSTRPDDFMGEISLWDRAEAELKDILDKRYGKDGYDINEGDGAFYGPKIDIIMKDCLGRQWQMGTVQLDFQLPRNFGIVYVAADNTEKIPVIIHRVIYGSLERFMGILIEQFKGSFPFWLAPTQVGIVPIREEHNEYAREVAKVLRKNSIHIELDTSDTHMNNKIKNYKHYKVPYVVVIGNEEVENKTVSINLRDGRQVHGIKIADFVKMCNYMNRVKCLDLIAGVDEVIPETDCCC